MNLKRWVIWNVILKDAGCSNGLIVNTQLTLHLCKLVLEFQELSDSDNRQCYLIISLHSYLQICKGTKIVISILFAFECWPAFSYKSYQIKFVFLAKLNSPLILESSDYPCNHRTNILKHIKAWFLFLSLTPMGDQDKNFSLQYQYNIKQTSDENKEKYQLGDYKLIQYQILQTNITRTVWENYLWDLGS